jgi:ABC-type Fe3+ transport system permease subunit
MKRRSGSSSLGCLPYLIVLLFVGLIFALFAGWTEGNMEWLFSKVAGRPIDVSYWLALAANLLTNIFGIVFNILCELAKLVWP